MILGIVNERGKMQNPVTGSGGMFIGKVAYIGEDLDLDIKVGDKIASLVSLSMTPLKIDEIIEIHPEIDRVDIKGQAVLFESALYAKLPDDISEPLALAALDVAGAPAQTAKLVKTGSERSGSLVVLENPVHWFCYEAMKRVESTGRVVAMDYSQDGVDELLKLGVCHKAFQASAALPVDVLEKALAANDGKEYDVSICCVNVNNCEMSAILPVHDGGIVYFFSMATSFTKAALGAEGVGKDVDMIIGNGYTKGHAEITLQELRENEAIRNLFDQKYV